MTTQLVPEANPMPVYLERWDITVPFVRVGEGPIFVVVRQMCDQLEIDVDSQMKKIWDDDNLNQIGTTIMELRVPTKGGRQVMWCLRKAEAASWVGKINARRVKESVRGRLEEVQQDLIQFADRLIFGDLSGVVAVSTRPPTGGVLDVGCCPRCTAHLHFVVSEQGVFLKLADE